MGQVIGIDLGTTNTVVHYKNKKGKINVLRYEGESIVPSVIFFNSKDEYKIGKEADKLGEFCPDAVVKNFKSMIGDNTEKVEIKAQNGDKFKLKPKAIIKRFLQALFHGIGDKIVKEFNDKISHVVITVPAKFNSTQKDLIKKAAKEAGIDCVKLAKEPTAAAIACHSKNENIKFNSLLVYDFGGGTFDVSVIRKSGGYYEEVATGGDKFLGGNNLTYRLAQRIMEDFSDEYGIEFPFDEDDLDEDQIDLDDYLSARSQIIDKAEAAKKELSDDENVKLSISANVKGDVKIFTVNYNREEFNELIYSDIVKTANITKNVIADAKKKGIDKIDYIVLAGGSSYIPLIRDILEENLPEYEVFDGEDFSYLISTGAAVLGQRIDSIDDITSHITNTQMGVRVLDGVTFNKFKMLIPDGKKLPFTVTESFRLVKDGQTELEIPYYEYDVQNYPNVTRVNDEGIEEVDKLIITNLPNNLSKENIKIAVTFTMYKDGSLEVKAVVVDNNGNALQSVEVKKESEKKEGDLE